MSNRTNPIRWLKVSGTPFDIGHAIGAMGRKAVHAHLIHSNIWVAITSPDHRHTVLRLMENTRARFPEIYEELRGMANGLQLPLSEVFAWNCRGDLLPSVPDGCTTIQTPGEVIQISHNEDGLPFFRGYCFIVDAKPSSFLPFRSFCYPGSLAGHTFGWNDAGLAQAVNNLRLRNVEVMIPRMVLARAVLSSPTLEGALNLLSNDPVCGGFHMTLAQSGEPELISMEYGNGTASIRPILSRAGHANHALHLISDKQMITQSSGARQTTVARLVKQPNLSDLDILRDTSGSGLPIRRDSPDDPDQENTLATCLFNVFKTGVEWKIYSEKNGAAEYQSERDIA